MRRPEGSTQRPAELKCLKSTDSRLMQRHENATPMRMQHPGECNTPIPSALGSISGAKSLQRVIPEDIGFPLLEYLALSGWSEV